MFLAFSDYALVQEPLLAANTIPPNTANQEASTHVPLAPAGGDKEDPNVRKEPKTVTPLDSFDNDVNDVNLQELNACLLDVGQALASLSLSLNCTYMFICFFLSLIFLVLSCMFCEFERSHYLTLI